MGVNTLTTGGVIIQRLPVQRVFVPIKYYIEFAIDNQSNQNLGHFGESIMDYGRLYMNIENILEEKGVSKNRLCKDLDIARTNLNRYCRNDFQRIDASLVCKLCGYLDVGIDELIKYEKGDAPDYRMR